jgi:hypothetical protein
MIVRIATEGQYRLTEEQLPRLHELDPELVVAAESADAELFSGEYADPSSGAGIGGTRPPGRGHTRCGPDHRSI